MATQKTPGSSKLKVLIDPLRKAAGGAALGEDLSAGILENLCSKAKDLSSAAVRGRC